MTLLTKALSPIRAAFKAAALIFSGRSTGWGWNLLPRTNLNYAATVADGRGSTIVQACVAWMCKTFPEAPIQVRRRDSKGELKAIPDHPMTMLLRRPNPYYSGTLLWWATLSDFNITGNAYWLKVRSRAGLVVEVYWIPSGLIEPRWPDDGTAYLSHYEYTPGGRVIRYDPSDVVHFRYGLDPNNIRKGLSPLASLFRELFTDEEASNFSASVLRNLGVPGLMVAPENTEISREDAEVVKADIDQRFGGDNRGRTMVMQSKTQVQVLGFSPEQMTLRELRRIPEERVSAIYGTPAVVVGLGAGLDRSTYNNMGEAKESAYEANMIPMQRLLADDLGTQLLPDFGNSDTEVVDFDTSGVRVLQEDQDKLHTRIREDVKAGIFTVDEARQKLGDQPLPNGAGDVLYIGIGVTPTAPEDLLAPPEPVMAVPPPAIPLAGDGDASENPMKPKMLPPGRKERKSAATIGAAIERLRQRLQTSAQRDTARFLGDQRSRVLSRLGDDSKAAELVGLEPEDLLPDAEVALLRDVLTRHHHKSLVGVHALVEDALGISFELDDPTTRAFLAEAGQNIVGIQQHTLEAVRGALQAGQAEGEGVGQLAARLRDLPEFGRARARVVARTEMANSSNLAALHSYRASGVVVGIQVMDGDYDEECAQMDGRIFSLDEAASIPAIAHPNCQRALVPVTDASELEAAA